MEEEIKTLYKENGSLKARKDKSATKRQQLALPKYLRRCGESTRKNKTNRNKQKEHKTNNHHQTETRRKHKGRKN